MVFLLSGLILSTYQYRKWRLYRFRGMLAALVYLSLFLMAFAHTSNTIGGDRSDDFSKHPADILYVVVDNEPVRRADILRFECRVIYAGSKQVQGKLLVALKTGLRKAQDFKYGDLLLIPAAYHEVEPPYNPAEFDFKYFLKTRQIHFQCFINQHQVRKLGDGYGNPLIAFALQLRSTVVAAFRKYIPDTGAAALASTLIMGYRADLSPEVLSAYAKTGTMHVLSVSGMHVALVFILLSFLLKPLDRFRVLKGLRVVLLLAMIWFYALISGFSPSVNRAALMLSFVIAVRAFNKSMNTYNLLAVSAFILLLYHPLYLLDIGFQLSYLAVFGLVFFHPYFNQLLVFRFRALDAVWSYVTLSVAAQIPTFPLSVYAFHQFPIYFILSNLLIILPVTLLMYVGVFFVMILPFGMGLAFLGKTLYFLIHFTNRSLFWIENLPFSSLQGLWISPLQMICLYLFIGLVVWAIVSRSKRAVFLSLFCLIFILAEHAWGQHTIYQTRKLIFYSLRKNLAIAYQQAERYDLITDLKVQDKAEQFSVQPSLQRSGLYCRTRLRPDEAHYSSDFCTDGKLMQFGIFRLYRWSAADNRKQFASRMQVDALLLNGNPNVKIEQIGRFIDFKRLIIDGTNPDYKIRKWLDEAAALGIRADVLKKNKALEISF